MNICNYNEMLGLRRMEGSSSILGNFASKAGASLGSLVTGLVLAIGGFISTTDLAATAQPEANTSATMSLQSEYGDILLAIERAWEDARKDKPGHENTMVDTNTVTDATDDEENLG